MILISMQVMLYNPHKTIGNCFFIEFTDFLKWVIIAYNIIYCLLFIYHNNVTSVYLEGMCLVCLELLMLWVLHVDLFAPNLARHLCVVVDKCRRYTLLLKLQESLKQGQLLFNSFSVQGQLLFNSFSVQGQLLFHSFSVQGQLLFNSFSVQGQLLFNSFSVQGQLLFNSFSVQWQLLFK